MAVFTESDVENAALGWLAGLGYTVRKGQDIAPDSGTPERTGYGDVILPARLHAAVRRLNPDLPPEAHDEA
ncbi:MAG: hypothetical protein GDA39_06580, partial [Hyphomonadaceae bacterium]|nr:hypothetical protein [Hyphomonadaceae bacterium]